MEFPKEVYLIRAFYHLDDLSEDDLLQAQGGFNLFSFNPEEDNEDEYHTWEFLEKRKDKLLKFKNMSFLNFYHGKFTPENIRILAGYLPYTKKIKIDECSEFSFGAIEAFQHFPRLNTLILRYFHPKNYFQLQEFSKLTHLKNLIVENSDTSLYNFCSLDFLKSMNLQKIEIENLISFYTPVINGSFTGKFLNNKALQNKEQALKKLKSHASNGSENCFKVAAQMFSRGMIDEGIEYLYRYAQEDDSNEPLPLEISRGEDCNILYFKWLRHDVWSFEYLKRKKYFQKFYPETEIPLEWFNFIL